MTSKLSNRFFLLRNIALSSKVLNKTVIREPTYDTLVLSKASTHNRIMTSCVYFINNFHKRTISWIDPILTIDRPTNIVPRVSGKDVQAVNFMGSEVSE
jgi:dTDP-4-dehydrorhamnose 3,5-epimerase-like enzyme